MSEYPEIAALSPEREAEIRETQLGDWYSGEWVQVYVEGDREELAHYVVKHCESRTVLAELPDWAGPIALWMADAHDAVPELLAEVERLRARVANAQKLVAGWKQASEEHRKFSESKVMAETPGMAGKQEGRSLQLLDCADELADVLNGDDPDEWEYGIGVDVLNRDERATEGGAR